MRRIIAALLLASVVLSSCTHKELCFGHHHTARVRVLADWSGFTVEQPTGMSVHIYDEDGDEVKSSLSNNTEFTDFELEPGGYEAVVFNQSPSEFGSVRFEDLNRLDQASVWADYTKSLWFKADADEPVICQPEWVGTDMRGGLAVDMNMMATSPEARRTRSESFPQENVLARLTPENIIYTITITVRIYGIHNLKAARGSLSGLSAGYFLGKEQPASETGTELLEEWTVTRDDSDPTKGFLKAEITSFGLPYGHQAQPQDNVFKLSLLLVDNKTKLDYIFPVGDRFKGDADRELHLELSEEIADRLPDVKPENGSAGGFDASVDDWGDEEIIDIPI